MKWRVGFWHGFVHMTTDRFQALAWRVLWWRFPLFYKFLLAAGQFVCWGHYFLGSLPVSACTCRYFYHQLDLEVPFLPFTPLDSLRFLCPAILLDLHHISGLEYCSRLPTPSSMWLQETGPKSFATWLNKYTSFSLWADSWRQREAGALPSVTSKNFPIWLIPRNKHHTVTCAL